MYSVHGCVGDHREMPPGYSSAFPPLSQVSKFHLGVQEWLGKDLREIYQVLLCVPITLRGFKTCRTELRVLLLIAQAAPCVQEQWWDMVRGHG